MFEKILDCVPPWYTGTSKIVCDKVFNMTKTEDEQIKTMFQPQTCKIPCTETVFETQLLFKNPSLDPVMSLNFDPIVQVTRSSFSISVQTLVGRLGGQSVVVGPYSGEFSLFSQVIY